MIDGVFYALIMSDRHIEEIPECVRDLGIISFKFHMVYRGREAESIGLPGYESCDDGMLYAGFKKIREVGYPVKAMVHTENPEIYFRLSEKLIAEGRDDLAAWTEARPSFVEEEALRSALFIAKVTHAPLYVVHMSIGRGVNIVAQAKAEGMKLTVETCPHYLTLTKDIDGDPRLAKVNPSLKDKEDVERLWWGIQHGLIDTLGTDHCALTKDLKNKTGDLWHCVPGFPGVATLLPVMLSEGVNKGRISLEKMVEVCSYNTAKTFALYPKKGAVKVGSDADLVIVDLDKRVKVTPEILKSSSDYTLYDGWEFRGWPSLTMVRGTVVMEEGEIVGKPGTGEYIQYKK